MSWLLDTVDGQPRRRVFAQLGLKLDRTEGPVDVLVIESIPPPTEN